MPVFKLTDFAFMYQTQLEQLSADVEGWIHTSRLKERFLSSRYSSTFIRQIQVLWHEVVGDCKFAMSQVRCPISSVAVAVVFLSKEPYSHCSSLLSCINGKTLLPVLGVEIKKVLLLWLQHRSCGCNNVTPD